MSAPDPTPPAPVPGSSREHATAGKPLPKHLQHFSGAERIWLQISHYAGLVIALLLVAGTCVIIGGAEIPGLFDERKAALDGRPDAKPTTAGTEPKTNVPATPLSRADLIEAVEPSVVRIDVKKGDKVSYGSGFVVESGGMIFTNAHVIDGAAAADVVFSDGARFPIRGTYTLDQQRDIALIAVDLPADRRMPLPFATGLPRKGESALACGSPFGFSFTVSEGIVSAIRTGEELAALGIEQSGTWIQTTTPISPGSSGGPLVNERGEVIAANTMQIDQAQNLNFGIAAVEIQSALANRSDVVTPLASPSPVQSTPVASAAPQSTPQPLVEDIVGSREAATLLSRIQSVKLVTLPEGPRADAASIRRAVTDSLTREGVEVREDASALLVVAVGASSRQMTASQTLLAKLFLSPTASGAEDEPRVLFLLWECEEPVDDARAVEREVDRCVRDFARQRRDAVR